MLNICEYFQNTDFTFQENAFETVSFQPYNKQKTFHLFKVLKLCFNGTEQS